MSPVVGLRRLPRPCLNPSDPLPHQNRLLSLDESRTKIDAPHKSSVTWLDLDYAEQRFLLSSSHDGSLAIFDLNKISDAPCSSSHPSIQSPDIEVLDDTGKPSPYTTTLKPDLTVLRGKKGHHKHPVTSCAWYTIDSGLFATGTCVYLRAVNPPLFVCTPTNLSEHLALPLKLQALWMPGQSCGMPTQRPLYLPTTYRAKSSASPSTIAVPSLLQPVTIPPCN